jgi:hypothetical protein
LVYAQVNHAGTPETEMARVKALDCRYVAAI